MERRGFVKLAGMAATMSLVDRPMKADWKDHRESPPSGTVDFSVDGLGLSPREYSQELVQLSEGGQIRPDYYSVGGTITEMEQQFAKLLGKESAIFLPTGTLANHLAVRQLAGNDRRVLVQAESHLYNDCGDCSGTLSGLTLIPLAPAQATFTLGEVKQWVERTASGKVEASIGAISIESPVRRCFHEMFDFEEMKKICAYSRAHNIRLHLDGARLFNIPYHSGRTIEEITSLFDTVYVSLWKCFNAASGAILAGSRQHMEDLFHVRRMFGGSLPQAWPIVAVASHYSTGYLDEYARAWRAASPFLAALEKDGRFTVERVVNGTSAFKLRVRGINPNTLAQRLRSQDIVLPHPDDATGVLRMIVNTSLNRANPEALARAFAVAARG
jgi:threonine aldolase